MSTSDVKLYDNHVDVEGVNQFVVKGWDLVLDAQDRRSNQTQFRRALVHDQGDKLTINYAGDYPQGVQINGSTQINGNASTYSTEKTAVLRIQSAPASGGFGTSAIEFWSDPQGSSNEWRPACIRSSDKGDFTGGLRFYVNGTGSNNKTGSIEVMNLDNTGMSVSGTLKVKKGGSGPLKPLPPNTTSSALSITESTILVETSSNIIGFPSKTLDLVKEINNLRKDVDFLATKLGVMLPSKQA